MKFIAWRIETYTGIPVPEVTRHLVFALARHSTQRQALWRYLRWIHQMRRIRSTPAVWLRSSAPRDDLERALYEGRSTKDRLVSHRASTVFAQLRSYPVWSLWVPVLVVLCFL